VNVVVIGGGAIGCAVAFVLSRRGCSVTLLDKALPGRASAASAGGLWPVGESIGLGCGVIFHSSQSEQGDTPPDQSGPQPMPRVFMDFLVESNAYFPELTRELEKRTGIHIESELGTGLLYVIYDAQEQQYADFLLGWLGQGDTQVEKWSASQVCEREPMITRDQLGGIYFPGDNQVNPMLLFEACKRAACKLGAKFVPDTEVTGIEMNAGLVSGVQTSRGRFACDALVNAAGAWSARIASFVNLELPVYPIRGQILCTETLKKTLSCNVSTSGCYLLQKAHGEIIIGSTTEHSRFDTSVPIDSLQKLAAGAQRAMPRLRNAGIKRSWSGLRPGTPDEFPILGPVSEIENYFNATGGFRTGIVATPLTAEIVAAQVLGEPTPFGAEPFLASRFEARSTGDA
jgi:hydrogen cyanide synthase HcnC